MNNLPLQPLFWDWSYGDGGKTRAVCRAKSPSHEYIIRMGDRADVYYVDYRKFDNDEDSDNRKDEQPVFGSIKAAQEWAEDTHYASKMQPYVKPSPTWIDASERLPEEDGLYLTLRKGFTFEMGNESDLVPKVSGWNGGRGCFDDDHGNVLFTHWMPLPELPANKGSDCE